MNYFAHIKSQRLSSLIILVLAITPITSTFAILPMAAEIFQIQSTTNIATNDNIMTDDSFAFIETKLMTESCKKITANGKTESITLSNDYQQDFNSIP